MLEVLLREKLGDYTLAAIEVRSKVKIHYSNNFKGVWPEAFEIYIEGEKCWFLSKVSGFHYLNLRAPGAKRFYFLEDVQIPWGRKMKVNIVFAYEMASTDGFYFLIDKTEYLDEILDACTLKANVQRRKIGWWLMVLFFPLYLLLYKPIFSKKITRRPLPALPNFLRFIGRVRLLGAKRG